MIGRMVPSTAIWTLTEQQHGLVGRRQLNELGIDGVVLRPLIRAGALIAVTDQVLRAAGSPQDDLQAAMAAVLDAPPGAALSHRSAAALWGLPGFRLEPPFHVIVPHQGTTRRLETSIVHFQRDLPMEELLVYRGIAVTSPALTVFHLAAILHPAQTERALDNGVARNLLTTPKFARLTKRLAARGRNGSRVARQLAAARSGDTRRPESGLESRVLWCAGCAEVAVEAQVDVGDDAFVGRVDFKLVGLPGVIEAQSALHHTSLLDRSSDEARAQHLLDAGLSVFFVWDHQAFQRGQVVIREIRRFRDDVASSRPPFFRECPSE